MNLVRMDNENGCLRGQEPDGFDGGVLDQQFSNIKAGRIERPGYLDWETGRWTNDHGITGQSKVLE